MALPDPLPDNPMRWEGWRNYNSEDPYERLCLDFAANPSSSQIEENCRQLLVWWQKKLPLKNQPSNPLAQMLRAGMDEAPKCLVEARTELLNSVRRAEIDAKISDRLKQVAWVEFNKFFSFSVAGGVLSEEDEQNLYHLGAASGLGLDEMKAFVNGEIVKRSLSRQQKIVVEEPAPSRSLAQVGAGVALSPEDEFRRLLRLSGLGDGEMTDDQRDAFCNMGENLGLTGGQAEDLIDEYLDEASGLPPLPKPVARPTPQPAKPAVALKPASKPASAPAPQPSVRKAVEQIVPQFSALAQAQERQKYPNFRNSAGIEMQLVTSGSFFMGSTAFEAAPNERPLSKVTISAFFISRFPVTNAQYEMFDRAHASKRAPWADDSHPVVYVNSLEAIKFCEWLSARERKKYRLPTEAEWEFAARGLDGRSFPWGEKLREGNLANFADRNTTFAWRDPEIDDGYPQSSPVGNYPRGASPFGIEEMAGNVWEWCLDFFEPYTGKERVNPRSKSGGPAGRRVYRGGSWKSRAASLRATARNFNLPDYSSNDVGFRIVCECGL